MNQILEHCEDNDLFPNHQFACRKFHSCETLVLKLTDEMLWNMANGCITGIIFIDLSAAFDTVDHDILLQVMQNIFQVNGNVYHWIQSYLTNRNFRVCINDNFSDIKDLSFSVPKGSCNGSIYFDLYCSTIR